MTVICKTCKNNKLSHGDNIEKENVADESLKLKSLSCTDVSTDPVPGGPVSAP